MDKGGWVVCERKKDVADGREKIFFLSSRYLTQEEALKQRDRMLAKPENQGRALDVTYEHPKAPPRRRGKDLRRSKH